MNNHIKHHNQKHEDRNVQPPICPYCGDFSKRVTGRDIYPHRQDLYNIKMYECRKCDARIGCHGNTWKPLGTLANSELRKIRTQAHASFDRIWREAWMDRKEAYSWLANKLEINVEDCHIGMFDIGFCSKVIELSDSYINSISKHDSL
jgi:hypothetical protein